MLQLLTIKAAAERLSVHPDTIRRLITRGEIRATKVGRNVRIEEGDLIAYVRGSSGPARPPAETKLITDGQVRAFHAKATELDQRLELTRGDSKRAAKVWATQRFGRQIESVLELSEHEAIAVLEQLEREIDAAPVL